MKHVLSGAVALAFGLGVAISAQAQNANTNMAPAQTPAGTQQHRTTGPAQTRQSHVNYPKSHKQMVKEAQTRLKQAGLYNGKIDGKWGPQSRQAFAQFGKQHNLSVGKELNRSAFAALKSTPATGVGSSTPHPTAGGQPNGMAQPAPAPTQAPAAGGSHDSGIHRYSIRPRGRRIPAHPAASRHCKPPPLGYGERRRLPGRRKRAEVCRCG
jgi:peptidoglycan hydrolase-like protein with peptidoglycan-binding domain